MQERNFEKQVQQKMEELSFVPSEPVWQKVEEQIKKKRERRRILFWLLPCLLLTGGLYFWMKDYGTENKTVVTNDRPVTSIKNNSNAVVNPQPEIEVTNKKEQPKTVTSKTTIPSDVAASKKIFAEKHTQQNFLSKNKTLANKTTVFSQPPSSKNAEEKLIAEEANKNTIEQRGEEEYNVTQSNTDMQPLQEKAEPAQDSVTALPDAKAGDTAAQKEPLTDSTKLVKPIVKTKWKWSAFAVAGFSGIVANKGNAKQAASPAASDFLSYNGASFQSAAPAPAPAEDRSALNNGFAFSVGANIGRTVSKRLTITAGLQYNYYSSFNYVGRPVNNATQNGRLNQRVDASVFYLANSSEEETYTNKYHYIGVPIAIEWKVAERLPLQLQGGVSLSRLVATNALYYDAKQRIYYEDDSYFNKTQVALFGGLSYRLKKFRTVEVYAGPQAQFSLGNLLDNKTFGNQHLFFAGLHTQFRF